MNKDVPSTANLEPAIQLAKRKLAKDLQEPSTKKILTLHDGVTPVDLGITAEAIPYRSETIPTIQGATLTEALYVTDNPKVFVYTSQRSDGPKNITLVIQSDKPVL